MKKKILAVVLSALLAALLVPAAAFAEGETGARLASEPTAIIDVEPYAPTICVGSTVDVTITINAPAVAGNTCEQVNTATLVQVSSSTAFTVGQTSVTIPIKGLSAGDQTLKFFLYKNGAKVSEDACAFVSVTVVEPSITGISPDPLELSVGETQTVTVAFDNALPTGYDFRLMPLSHITTDSPSLATDRKSATFNATGSTPGSETVTVGIYESTSATTPVSTKTFEVTVAPKIYPILEGAEGTYTIGSGTPYVFTVDADFANFEYLYMVDPDGKKIEVDSSNYDIASGSTVITLHSAFLDTLSPGEYEVIASYTDGYAVPVKLTIASASSGTTASTAKTGDAAGAFALLALIAAAGACTAAYTVRRRRND